MNGGELVIVIAALCSLAAAFLRFLGMHQNDRRLREVSVIFSILTFLLVTGALFFLLFLFVTSDMDYRYVWSYSSTDTSGIYKVSGVWAGASGSFLLWIWMMALVQTLEVILEPKRSYLSRKFHDILQISLAGVVFAFLLIMMDMAVFAETASWEKAVYPEGVGLSLALQTPEMVIHPPVVFAGYAFCVAALAAGLAYYVVGDRNWFMVALPWTRLSWVFLTLGIGIGAIWAYYVLGWGGYWAWDPVETSSLLPWLMTTAFLHALVRHVKKDEYEVVAPALGMLSFTSVVFATFATRAGGIWSSSVHTFDAGGSSSVGLDRLLELLRNDNVILGLFALLMALFALSITFAIMKSRHTPLLESEPPPKISDYISDKNNMLLTVILFIATSAVMLLLLFKNVDVAQAANYDEFNQKMAVFLVAISVTMTICLMWKMLGKEWAFLLGIGLIAASAILGISAVVGNFANGLVAFSAPSYAVAIGVSAIRISRSKVPESIRKTLQQASPHIIHLGVALVLLGYVVSSTMQVYPVVAGETASSGVVVGVGESMNVGDYTVRLVSLSVRNESIRAGGSMIDEAREATVDILRDGKVVESGVILTNLYGIGSSRTPQVMGVEVHIQKTVLRDLYINFQWRSTESALIEAKTLPLMNVLWGGLGLLAIGLAIRLITWQFEPKAQPPRRSKIPGGKRSPETKKLAQSSASEKDYDALVEEELRKFKEKKAK
ncbi:MAG: hypothetical protein A3K60_04350 [Euryarchaeota archaeon RBG_19FT_COMBO_56_21]|nr:MAG: hypothetical protein A3K60_04350 [Euryarchaeota archaeon RBG_19FT_COMBO_56_21]